MRKRIPILVAFFMVLYIVPLISMPTYDPSTILAQPNMTKEFSESAYLDESSYSLDGFSETLADDVFYTPDGFYDETPVTASQGYDDWADSIHFNDSQYWSSFDTIDEYALFRGDHSIEGFAYSIYGRALSANGNVTVYDTMIQDQYVLFEMVTGSDAWYNGTYWGTNYEPTQVYLILEAGTGGALTIDYIELRFHYLPLLDYSYSGGFINWGESFTNVSDWTTVTGNGITSDGDICTQEIPADAEYDYVVFNDISLATEGYYLEVRHKENTALGTNTNVVLKSADDYGGDTVLSFALQESTHWKTEKIYISSNLTTESIALIHKASTGPLLVQFDYLRISPSTEMGWQHDGSTTTEISSSDGGTIATGGDAVTLTADGDGSTFLIVADTTATATAISCTYYPFLSLDIDSGSGNWTLEQYDGSAYATLQSSTAISAGIKRFNMLSLDTYVAWWRITLTASSTLLFDWTKAYSIANFTVTQSTVGINEYAYVTGGELHFNMDGDSDYILLDHDPTISVDSATYNRWILDIDNIGTGTSHTDDFGIDFYVGAWQGYTYDETNSTMPTGITTDFRIISYDAYSLQSIIFWDAHQWRIVDSKIIYFALPEWHLVESVSIIIWLEIITWGLDVFLIILGMFLVPGSTLYLVKGGKDNMSMDKVFYFIVAFLFGWGLIFIGVS